MDQKKLRTRIDCNFIFDQQAAELIGMKIFFNEFIAYGELAEAIKARDNGTIPRIDSSGINWISERTEAIVTYALCGFANVGSLGIMLGGLGKSKNEVIYCALSILLNYSCLP